MPEEKKKLIVRQVLPSSSIAFEYESASYYDSDFNDVSEWIGVVLGCEIDPEEPFGFSIKQDELEKLRLLDGVEEDVDHFVIKNEVLAEVRDNTVNTFEDFAKLQDES